MSLEVRGQNGTNCVFSLGSAVCRGMASHILGFNGCTLSGIGETQRFSLIER
jgi:hypothetical protein